MVKRPTDAEVQTTIRRAVRTAEVTARDDDRAFLEALRSHVPSPSRENAGVRRTRALRASTNARLADDPRYLANLRELARRGAANARILGGSAVRGTTFHDCVAVGTDDDWGCTGTLIRPNVVLTAAHCEEYHTRVFIGNDVDGTGHVIKVAKAIPHPRFDEHFHNDLMLLVLERKVTGVKPRKLASKVLVDAATDARVVGFGHTNSAGSAGYGIKRQTDVPIVSTACQGRVGRRSDGVVYGCHRGSELVAGKPFLLQDTCKGDSGGPLYVAGPRGSWLLAGVTSRGTDLAQTMCGDGGLYVRVDAYSPWIESAIARLDGK